MKIFNLSLVKCLFVFSCLAFMLGNANAQTSSRNYYQSNPVTNKKTVPLSSSQQQRAQGLLQRFGPPSQIKTKDLINDLVRIKNSSAKTRAEVYLEDKGPPLTQDETKYRVKNYLDRSEYVPSAGNKSRFERFIEIHSKLNPPVVEQHKKFLEEESQDSNTPLNQVDPSVIKNPKVYRGSRPNTSTNKTVPKSTNTSPTRTQQTPTKSSEPAEKNRFDSYY